MKPYQMLIPMFVGGLVGLAISSLLNDTPKTPLFHETLGVGSRVTLFVNEQNQKFGVFSYKGTEYRVKLSDVKEN